MPRLLQEHIFNFIKFFWFILDNLLNFIFGYSLIFGWKDERLEAGRNMKNCQLVDILFIRNCTDDRKWFCQPGSYITKHITYLSVQEAIQTKATLYQITRDYATFCISSEDLVNARQFPFMSVSQSIKIQKMLLMPIEDFHRGAKEMKELSKDPLAFIIHTGRCGSTLMGQIMYQVPQVKVISGAIAFAHITYLRNKGHINQVQQKALVNSTVKWLCRGYENVVMKLQSMDFVNVKHLKQLCPLSAFMFICRSPGPCIVSRHLNGTPVETQFSRHQLDHLSYLDHDATTRAIEEHKNFLYNCKEASKHRGQVEATNYVLSMCHFKLNRDIFDMTIIYEELVEDPRGTITGILKGLNLDVDLLSRCLLAMEVDSQNGMTRRSQQNRAAVSNDPDFVKTVNGVFETYDLPLNFKSTVSDLKRFLSEAK